VKSAANVAADFDEIAAALATSPPRRHLTPAERALLAYVPQHARSAIDVGCGDGLVSRSLAARGVRTLGVDISSRMIALARARTPAELDVEYRQLDIMSAPEIDAEFDVVMSITMVHHLPLDVIVPRLAQLVAPGGVLLIQDLVDRERLVDIPLNLAGAISRRARSLILRESPPRAVRRSYAAHGTGETYLRSSDVALAYARFVPGARVLQHLEWRYSVIWTRPH
jgi:2-polyprenyl-3-methyl-5-hydroxy-6-metoxy-1,4-benzoquinol methylase